MDYFEKKLRIKLFLFSFIFGIYQCYEYIFNHVTFFVDSGMNYRNMLLWNVLSWDYRHNRISDLIFQIPGLLYLNIFKNNYDFNTWLSIMDWSRFGGEFLLFISSIALCLYYKNFIGFLTFFIVTFSHYFVFAANAGGNSGSALGYFCLLASLFFLDLYSKKRILFWLLLVLVTLSYQSFFIGIFFLAAHHVIFKIFNVNSRTKYDWVILLGLLFAAAYMILKILDPQTPKSEGFGTFLILRPGWQFFILFSTLAAAILLLIKNRKVIFLISAFFVLYFVFTLYKMSVDFYEIRFTHAMNARSIVPLFSMVTIFIFLIISEKQRIARSNISKISQYVVLLIVFMSLIVVKVHNFYANKDFSSAVYDLSKMGMGKSGCVDVEHSDAVWSMHNRGVILWSFPIISFLMQKTKSPDFVLLTLSDYELKNGRRTCSLSYNVGLIDADELEWKFPLKNAIYIDFSKVDLTINK